MQYHVLCRGHFLPVSGIGTREGFLDPHTPRAPAGMFPGLNENPSPGKSAPIFPYAGVTFAQLADKHLLKEQGRQEMSSKTALPTACLWRWLWCRRLACPGLRFKSSIWLRTYTSRRIFFLSFRFLPLFLYLQGSNST
jgi:hypothetical protein